MRKIKRIFAFILSLCMLFNVSALQAYAENGDMDGESRVPSVVLENGKTYIVPLIFYDDGGDLQTGNQQASGGGVWGILDNIALISPNGDGTYHVTLQVENYKKIDIFQISKPGMIADDVAPYEAPMGTYNIPEKYFRVNPDVEDESKEITKYLSENGYIDESWNDRYFHEDEIDVVGGDAGVCWYSFDVDTLESSLYVKGFYSYYNTSSAASATYWSDFLRGFLRGKIMFDLKQVEQIETADDIAAGVYDDFGLEISKVDKRTHGSYFNRPGEERLANDCLADQASVVVTDDGGSTVTGQISDSAKVSSLQVLTEIVDHKDSAEFPNDRRFREYMYAYSNETISVYSENRIEDGKFEVGYDRWQEAVFGKEIKIVTEDGTIYYGELRVKTTPRQELKLTDDAVTLVTDNYTIDSQTKFKAELLQETTDEDSEYNKYYSLLAGKASKALIYNVSLKKDNEQIRLSRGVELRVKIPQDWETDKIEVHWLGDVWTIFNPINYFDATTYTNADGSIRMDGDELVLKGTARVYGTIAIIQKAEKVDISAIQDGVYKVNVTMWQLEQPDRLSMSNSAVISDSARLEVTDGGADKWIYFDTQGVEIAGIYGYANNILWADDGQTEEFTPLEYYSYHLDESGSTQMDDYAKVYDLYYPKTVGFKLPASADRDSGVYLEFCVPIMDELQGVTPGSGGGSRTAFMTLSGLEQQLEIDTPVHDVSVLAVAADKASKYNADDYTEESYQVLSDAVARAQQIISGSVTATDPEIVALDKEIAGAIAALVEEDVPPEKKELKDLVESALKETNDGTYTENSWNSFQAAITSAQDILADEGAAESEIDKQKRLLISTREALVPADKQSQLFEGYPQIYPGTYSTGVKLLNATTDEDSMGNAAMSQTGTVKVSEQGEMTLEVDFHSLQFAGLTGYLYRMKKVDMDTVEYNQYGYPAKYDAEDVQILEEYTGTHDLFNDPDSEYYDQKTEGKWYPKRLSFPIHPGDNMFYVEVYVPVMESIGEGQGTKVARVSINWEDLDQETGIARDNSVLDALLAQVSELSVDDMPEVYRNVLQAAYLTAKDVRDDMNSTQAEIDIQITALQSAVDAAKTETQPVDKTALTALIERAVAEADRTDIYTAQTIERLKAAIADAQAVAEKETATKAEVQAQIAALNTAIGELEERPAVVPVDKTALQQAIAKAKEQAAQTTVYTADSIAVLNGAVAEAQRVYDNADALQADVDDQVKALNEAVAALKKQPVNETLKVTSPAAPAKVKAVSAAYNKIKITWSAVKGASGYEVYELNSSTKKYSRVTTVTGTSYTRKNLKTGTKYTYKIRAYTTTGKEKFYSSYSKTASARPALSKAAGVKAKDTKSKKAVVSWKKVSGASGYEVYRSTKKNAGFKKVTTIKKNSKVKYTDKKLKKGKTYYYKIRAYRTVGGKKVYASYSGRAKVKIKK